MEKIKRVEAWESLSDEQRKKLEEEYIELLEWDRGQRTAREAELKGKGEWSNYGLDANQEKFADIIAEKNRRFYELQKKYGFR